MRGFVITYKPKDAYSRVMINHMLFGRIVGRYYRGRKSIYYLKGMLHNTRFARLVGSKIFVESIKPINFEKLKEFGELTHNACLRDISTLKFVTGQEYWKQFAAEKGLFLKISPKQRKVIP